MTSKNAAEALAALAQESRLAIFRLLIREGSDGLSAGAIAERLGISASTLSFHLARFHRTGLVRSRREGRSIIYAADYAGMNALLTYLAEDCCQGLPEICDGVAIGRTATPASLETGGRAHETPARVRHR